MSSGATSSKPNERASRSAAAAAGSPGPGRSVLAGRSSLMQIAALILGCGCTPSRPPGRSRQPRGGGSRAMPELPEVETTMRALAARLAGRRVAGLVQRRADIRFPLPERLGPALEGRTVVRFARRAKYIECFLDDGAVLLLHLGMSGRLRVRRRALRPARAPRPSPSTTARCCASSIRAGSAWSTCGRPSAWPSIAGSRIWAWSRSTPASAGAASHAALAGRRTALKVALMDQRLVVGVGNIYASESLFRARLAPLAAGGQPDAARGAAAGQGHPPGAARSDRRRRLVLARLRPVQWRARQFPAQLPGLRPRGRALPGLRRAGRAHRAGRAGHLLLCASASADAAAIGPWTTAVRSGV